MKIHTPPPSHRYHHPHPHPHPHPERRNLQDFFPLCIAALIFSHPPPALIFSAYPHLLSLGPPVVQHVVVYYTCLVDANSGDSGKERGDREARNERGSGQGLSMQEVEVAECCWLDPSQVAVLCDRQGDCDASVESLVRGEGGGHVTGRIVIGSIRDRLAEGTRFALLQWLHGRQ